MTRRMALGAALAGLAAPLWAHGAPVIFAASSLKPALDAIFGGGAKISYGGSGALARQILQGAPADLFLSANPDWMDAAQQGGRLLEGSRVDLLGNRLVVIGPAGTAPLENPEQFVGQRVGMGFTQAVPAGQYGRAALEAMGLWERVAPHVVETESARAVLSLVARGELPFGIVYATDAQAEPGVRAVFEFAPASHPPIRYPLAMVAGSHAFDSHDRLRGPDAAAVFADFGFEVL